jgi:hypothetical protein
VECVFRNGGVAHGFDRSPPRQQMRWTPRGAHFLPQVRCAVLNGDAAEKLNAYEAASAHKVDSEVEQFLKLLKQAA